MSHDSTKALFFAAMAALSIPASLSFTEARAIAAPAEPYAEEPSVCRVPPESIPFEKASDIRMNKDWGWGKFRDIGTMQPVCFEQIATAHSVGCRHWGSEFVIWKDGEEAHLPVRDVDGGIGVDFYKHNDTWLGITYLFRTALDRYQGRPGGCADLRTYSALQFDVVGTAKLRVRLVEGTGGKDVGEDHHRIVLIDPAVGRYTVRIPFNEFVFRKDYQGQLTNRAYFNRRLELDRIGGIAWEALCPDRLFDCGSQWFQLMDVRIVR